MLAKYYFRCTVCNDIHFGVSPPMVCPTCGATRAYVRCDEKEAGVIQGFMAKDEGKPFTASEVSEVFEEFTSQQEFVLNPDREGVNLLIKGVVENEKRHGLKYCPCRMTNGKFEEDLALVCPCNFRVQKTWKEKGECWCGLFVKKRDL